MKFRICLVSVFALLLTTLSAAPLPVPQTGDMLQITLEGLLSQNPNTPGRALMMAFNRLNGHWLMGGGHSPSFNRGTHRGVIRFAEPDTLERFRLQLDLQGDAWVRGGFAEVSVTWQSEDGRNYLGRFEGQALGQAVSGIARGIYLPAVGPLPGFETAVRGEHPRLLLRRAELPALRERAETEFGRAALARFPESAVGLGVLYHLREDPAYAGRAMEAVRVHMADMDSGDKSIRHRFWGYRLEQIAITYDLCHAAWPEDFRAEVQAYILALVRRMHRERGSWTEYVQWHPENAYNASMIYSSVIGMLVLADVTGRPPAAPQAPEIDAIAAQAWTGDPALPRVAVEPGEMPATVWYSGPVSQEQFHAFREANGDLGVLTLDPEAIRILPRDSETRGIERNRHTGNHYAICVNRASGTAFDTWNIFAARWQVTEGGIYHYASHHGGVVPYLNGVRVGNSTLLRLEPGEYTLVLAAPLGRPNPWAGVFVRPTLRPVTDAEVEEMQAAKNELYAQAMIFYRQERADWEALGGIDPAVTSLLRDALFWFRLFEETKFGAAGSQVGSTNSLALEGAGLMTTLFRRATGRPLARDNGLAFWLPRKLMAFSWTADGQEIGQDFFGRADFRTIGFQDERDNRGLVLASHFPAIAPEFQPAALWFWQKAGDPLTARSLPRANRLIDAGHPGTSYNSIPVYAFLHMPPTMTAKPPAEVLPLNWVDPLTGDVIFRNGFLNETDIVLQATAQQVPNRAGRQTSGAFALRGLGHNWTADQVVSMTTAAGRTEHPLVLTQHPAQHLDGTGRVLGTRTFADGSGLIHMDLTEAYRMRVPDGEGFLQTWDNAGVLYPESLVDDGGRISAFRSMLIDYSGDAGVPAVLIIHDRLTGVEDHFWSWPLGVEAVNRRGSQRINTPIERIEIPTPENVRFFENGFHLHKEGAQMTVRFLSDAPLELGMTGLQNIRHIVHSTYQVRTRSLITASGSDSYLAIITLQEGEAPEITTRQQGNTSEITIGNATYLLRNGRIDFANRSDEIQPPPLAGRE